MYQITYSDTRFHVSENQFKITSLIPGIQGVLSRCVWSDLCYQ